MATFVIPNGTQHVNGNSAPYNTHSPGDIFYLRSTRSLPIKFQNITGSLANPCIIRNSGGQVVIDDSGYTMDAALEIYNCDYIELDGGGAGGTTYGFDLDGYRGLWVRACKNAKVHHIYLHDTDIAAIVMYTEEGDGGHYRASWTMGDCEVYNCFVVRSGYSGMYLGHGPDPYTDPVFETIKVYNNIVHYSGTESIQVRCSQETHVYGNLVWRSATLNLAGDRNGISLDRESGDVYCYNNTIIEPGFCGIMVYDSVASTKYFWNNVIRDTGYYSGAGGDADGILLYPISSGDNISAYIHHNTIVRSASDGVAINETAGTVEVFDNICVGSYNSDIRDSNSGSFVNNNQTGAVSGQDFVDDADDFHLTDTSPAKDNGSGRDTPSYDIDGTSRPQGSSADQGAYEYIVLGLARDQILTYLEGLGDGTENSILSGQHAGDWFFEDGWDTYIEALQIQTGKYVALVGADYAWDTWTDSGQNSTLIDHWVANGLVTISWHMYNPETGDGLNWTGGQSSDRTMTDLANLYTPGNSVYDQFRADLDQKAVWLQDLKDNGVVVLFRPFHEMNGNWSWWGDRDQTKFINLWQYVWDYYENTKGLDNLLWVYSPNRVFSGLQNSDYYYPGSGYVDVTGLDYYQYPMSLANIDNEGWPELLALGHPVALTECGPLGPDFTPPYYYYDYEELIDDIVSYCDEAVWFLPWFTNWAIVNQTGGQELLDHSWVITRDERSPEASTSTSTTTTSTSTTSTSTTGSLPSTSTSSSTSVSTSTSVTTTTGPYGCAVSALMKVSGLLKVR